MATQRVDTRDGAAIAVQKRPAVRSRLLVAAAVAAALLAGFTYASRYMDMVMGDLPAETGQAMAQLERISTSDVDGTFVELLGGMEPGDVRSLELETDEGVIVANLLRGEKIDTAHYSVKGREGVATRRAFDHGGNAVALRGAAFREEGSFARYEQEGAFYAALEGADFTLDSVQSDPDGIVGAVYTGPGGAYSLSYLQQGVYMEQGAPAGAVDVKVGGRNGAYLEAGGSRSLFVILDESGNSLVNSVGIEVDNGVSREQLLAASEKLVLKNAGANRRPGIADCYSEQFFAAHPDQVLRENAAAIASSLKGAGTWSGSGRTVSADVDEYDGRATLSVEFSTVGYRDFCRLLPQGTTVPFESRSWFAEDWFTQGTASYRGGDLVGMCAYNAQKRCYLNINLGMATDPYTAPLDLLGDGMRGGSGSVPVRVDRSGDIPLLVSRRSGDITVLAARRDGDTLCSVQLSAGEDLLGSVVQ